MKTPIEAMLDGVEWKPTEGSWTPAEGAADDLPTVTHEGVLEIAGHSLRVFQLSDGNRVIAAEDLERFFGEMEAADGP